MRLTLRTMLAYLDDILEPGDHADIGQKIQESEFATDLVHRTRDVLRSLRLGAPPVIGRGMGLDPNTVANYLDNTLPPERVADFEKICLESDVHLAEVAACHQILSLVLGEPAEVPPASRERMYQIPVLAEELNRAAVAPETPVAPDPEPPTAEESKKKERRKPEVPDYLRESERSRRRPIVAAVIAAMVLLAIAWAAFSRPGSLTAGRGDGDAAVDSNEAPPFEPPKVDLGAPADTAINNDNRIPPAPPGEVTPPGPTSVPPVERAAPPAPDEPAPPREPAGAEPAAAIPAEPPIERTPSVPEPTPALPPDENGDVPPLGEVRPDSPATDQVGVYITPSKNVLLRLDEEASDWYRLPSRASLAAGDRLLSLPTYRATITLTAGITLQLAGGTSVILDGADASGTPGLEIRYGRVVLSGVGRAGSRLRLRLGEEQYSVVLGELDSTMAIQLRRMQVPGADPEAAVAPVAAELYAASGRIGWEVLGRIVEVPSPAMWPLPGGAPQPVNATELPVWINSEPVTTIDQRASLALEPALSEDRAISLSLAELVDSRRAEVRDLATRASVFTGQFAPFVAALNDPAQRGSWPMHIETLQSALTLGPGVAGSVREAFVRSRGEDGLILYRMLWGYSDEDFEKGAAQQLIEYLDHERLDVRVLAFETLKKLTGMGLNYQPDLPEARRRQSVQRWKERLASGELQPK